MEDPETNVDHANQINMRWKIVIVCLWVSCEGLLQEVQIEKLAAVNMNI